MGKTIHKIDDVRVEDDFLLCVKFETGEKKLYDLKPLFSEIQAFKILQSNISLLKNVQVASGGYGVIWNEELDLSGDELWTNGELVYNY